jgi:FtsH-binding integral membrane protein
MTPDAALDDRSAVDESKGLSHWQSQGEGTTNQRLVLPGTWLAVAVPLAFFLETTAFFLYAALELDWSTFDSWWGLIVIMGSPLVAGAGLGLAFENMKRAIVLSWAVGASACIASGLLFALPYTLEVVDNTGKYTGLSWTAGFMAALAILPLSAIGAALAVSANNIE